MVEEAQSYLVAGREVFALQSWEVHPWGHSQDAWKTDEPRQQPRWRLCSGKVLMTYQLRLGKELEELAAVTLRKKALEIEHQTNKAHVYAGNDPGRATSYS